MKTRKFAYILAGLFAWTIQGCSLVEVTDIKPPYQLSEETVITDIASAEKVLTGAYAQLHEYDLIVNAPAITGSMGLSYAVGSSGGAAYQQFADNDVQSDNYLLAGIYTKWYYIINISSHIIEKTSALSTQASRKNEIVAEARFLRALAHFSLLRLYGQFFDTGSEYGIVTWDVPVKDVNVKPRSSVQETYAQIEEDLKFAVANAPAYVSGKYGSREAASMLLAKTYLYKQDYSQAAEYASAIVETPGAAQLESEFATIFTKWFTSKEVLLAPPFDDRNERNNKAFAFRSTVLPSETYKDLMEGDPRQAVTILYSGTALRNGKFQNTTANGQSLTANTEYYLRLAEAYLILAEALLRSGDSPAQLSEARDMINFIRERAGAGLIPSSVQSKAALLQAVLKEKQLELGCESGEEWFDLVRFAVEGDIDITDFKPNVTSPIRYIIPIPNASIQAANGVVKQNPGYE